eukprot:TRINITY_DN1299_c0_g1_i1.p1 TRINITY_DN1299_c0_g1~~TRINITY_DN1299_c0_g1_i1.p1  ORF type:complete len:282 (-),score=46.19 TRINITY_DN1299_c0_g1_i1:60-905(-)
MVRLFENLRKINEDLHHSWYFRLWVVFWIVLAVVSVVAFIEFAARSGEAGRDKNWELYIDSPSELQFPEFTIRPVDTTMLIQSYGCWHKGAPLKSRACGAGGLTSTCVAFDTSGVVHQASQASNFDDSTISCNFTTSPTTPTINQMLVWDVDAAMFTNFPSQFFAARNFPGAMVNLVATSIEPYGLSSYFTWKPSIEYLSNSATPGIYNLVIRIDAPFIEHYRERDVYNGWQALGDFGGFVFWCVILHIITMALLGFAFSNTSTFLGRGVNSSREERGQLL